MIYLIRHGETELNAARVVQPANTPLNAHGISQAARLGERLRRAGVARILCSDLPRARMTADPIARATLATVEYTPLLQERNFGDLRGRPYAEIGTEIFGPEFVPPGGEGWPEFDRRASAAWQFVMERAQTTSGNLVVVTHGLVCGSIARQHLSLPPGVEMPARWGNTSVTVCDRSAPHAVQLLNCVVHLDGGDDTAAPSGL